MSKRHWLYISFVSFGVLFYFLPANAAGDAFNLGQATILNSPSDVASWPVTATITSVHLTSPGVSVDFDKKSGPDRWPDQHPAWVKPGDTIQYTIWMFLNINGKWYGSGFLEMWYGHDPATDKPISDAPCNWYYAADRWAPMTGYQFKAGEQLGFMVTAGDARYGHIETDLKERSNVVVVPAPTDATDPNACPDNPDTGGNAFPKQPTLTPPTQGLPTDLGQLIQQIFAWALDILGISVFVMFFYSGFLWLTAAGNTSKIGEAKTHMTNAVFGAILLLSSYLILYTINPDFVKSTVNLPGLKQTTSTPTGNGSGGTCDSGFLKYGNKKAGEVCHFDILIPGSGIPPETECAGPDLACRNLKCQVSGNPCQIHSDCPLWNNRSNLKDYCGGVCQQSCSPNTNIPGVLH